MNASPSMLAEYVAHMTGLKVEARPAGTNLCTLTFLAPYDTPGDEELILFRLALRYKNVRVNSVPSRVEEQWMIDLGRQSPVPGDTLTAIQSYISTYYDSLADDNTP